MKQLLRKLGSVPQTMGINQVVFCDGTRILASFGNFGVLHGPALKASSIYPSQIWREQLDDIQLPFFGKHSSSDN